MKELTAREVEQVAGGIAWTTPALTALADTGSLGPLLSAFGLGYGLGTWLANNTSIVSDIDDIAEGIGNYDFSGFSFGC